MWSPVPRRCGGRANKSQSCLGSRQKHRRETTVLHHVPPGPARGHCSGAAPSLARAQPRPIVPPPPVSTVENWFCVARTRGAEQLRLGRKRRAGGSAACAPLRRRLRARAAGPGRHSYHRVAAPHLDVRRLGLGERGGGLGQRRDGVRPEVLHLLPRLEGPAVPARRRSVRSRRRGRSRGGRRPRGLGLPRRRRGGGGAGAHESVPLNAE